MLTLILTIALNVAFAALAFLVTGFVAMFAVLRLIDGREP